MSDQSGTPNPAAGWYADPAGGGGQRYWDGSAWTEHLHDAAPATPAPAAAEPVAAPVAPPMAPAAPAYAPSAYTPAPAMQYVGQPARSIGFAEAIKRGLSRWTNYSDRATVAEYWWFQLFAFLVYIPLYIIALVVGAAFATTIKTDADGVVTSTGGGGALIVVWLLFIVVALLLFFPTLALTVRRLHDGDRSGWWYLIAFVPFGSIVLLVFMIMAGTPGPNRYGPPVT